MITPQEAAPVVGFVSLVAIPLLGILSIFKLRITPFLISLLVVWLLVGLFVVGGGITPMGRFDIVTREDRKAWLENPIVVQIEYIWGVGIAIGIGLLLTVLVFEKWSSSRYYKIMWALIKIGGFIISFYTFIRLYVFKN